LTPVFKAAIQKGKVLFRDVDKFNLYVLRFEGKEIDIIVRKRKKSRTNPQNAWYWACVVAIPAEHFGYSSDEMHEAYKFMFLKRDEAGKPLTVRSTTTLSTKEFSEYTEQCRQFCAEEGIVIPDPDDVFLENKEVSPEVLAEEERTRAKMKEISKKYFNSRKPEQLDQKELLKFNELLWRPDDRP